jgi:hypothetical protein
LAAQAGQNSGRPARVRAADLSKFHGIDRGRSPGDVAPAERGGTTSITCWMWHRARQVLLNVTFNRLAVVDVARRWAIMDR